jgi:hypothetical protein
MGYPRSRLVDRTRCSVYHCVSRCVRRQLLLADAVRAAWIARRLEFLCSIFAVDVLEFSIMSNHIHLLLRIRPELAWCWTEVEIAQRWLLLRQSSWDAIACQSVPPEEEVARAAIDQVAVEEWRRRLADLGWFHKELKEPCARFWNREDDVTGPFWQGRYTSKVSEGDVALTVQAFYVLLNPVRAGMERGVGHLPITSIGSRMRRIVREIREGKHGDAVEAFERHVVKGIWQPVFPCIPGSAAELSDREYAVRVARGKHCAAIRDTTRKEAETILRLSSDASTEELMAMLVGDPGESPGDLVPASPEPDSTHRGRLRAYSPPHSLCRIPRHRLRPRQSSLPSPDLRTSEDAHFTSMENPFRRERIHQGSLAVLPGMTLGALIVLLDREGRQGRPDKPGVIARIEPSALDRFRCIAMEPQRGESSASKVCVPRLGAHTVTSANQRTLWTRLSGVFAPMEFHVRCVVTAVVHVMSEHRALIGNLLRQGGERTGSANSDANPQARGWTTPSVTGRRDLTARLARRPMIRWCGSTASASESLAIVAARRGVSRVVADHPAPAL